MAITPPTTPRPAGLRSLLGMLAYLRRYPGPVALAVGLLLVNIAIEMSLPQIIGAAVNQLERHRTSGASFQPWAYLQLFLALVVLRAVVGMVVGPIRNRLVQRVINDLRADLYDALQRQAFRFHDRSSSGELISRSTTDVSRLMDFLFACLFMSVDIGAALVATLCLVIAVHPMLGALVAATMIPTVVLIGVFAAQLQPRWREVHDLHGAMTTVIQENIAGVRVVKAFAREQAEIAKFRGRRDDFLVKLMGTVNYWATRVPLAQFLFGLSTPLVLWVGGGLVIRGTLAVGDLTKVVFYLMAIAHRLGMVGQFTNILQNASASVERIFEILKEPRAILDGAQPMPPGGGRVEFRQVTYSHPMAVKPTPSGADAAGAGLDERPQAALHDVSFQVEPGQTVAIVGPTGSGKSTLVSLIPRFYDPDTGEIRLDGVDLRTIRIQELRRSVGFIFQDTFLFSATVRENIAYGRPEATDEEIEVAARAAQAHGFITGLERGYATVIGERGVSLSGGQRQRLAIARAFLMNPRVLVLDDATASVDSETERLIQEALAQLSQGRTTFVIAQRISTVRNADLILVLREGRIVEQGRHEALLASGGMYREVFARQIHD
jgi:ABC-type multidrug transport system fused ATPase/permease subunit